MNYTEIQREQVATYLDTTPKATATLSLVGVGITNKGIAYNPQIDTEKWIINKNAHSNLKSFQIQSAVTQTAHIGDPVFEFVNELRRTLATGNDVETYVYDVDIWDEESTGVYKATKYECMVAVTNYMSDKGTIEYTIYYNGNPVQGTVTINGSGVATFTESATSL